MHVVGAEPDPTDRKNIDFIIILSTDNSPLSN